MNYVRGGAVGGVRGGLLRRRRRVVGFEYVEAFQFLVQDGQRLKLFCLLHLGLEPVLDLILLFFDEVLVVVVEMSGMVRYRRRCLVCVQSYLFSWRRVT